MKDEQQPALQTLKFFVTSFDTLSIFTGTGKFPSVTQANKQG